MLARSARVVGSPGSTYVTYKVTRHILVYNLTACTDRAVDANPNSTIDYFYQANSEERPLRYVNLNQHSTTMNGRVMFNGRKIKLARLRFSSSVRYGLITIGLNLIQGCLRHIILSEPRTLAQPHCANS